LKRLSMQTAAGQLAYDRSKVTPGIVHLGVGAFHRAHVANYIDSILPTDPTWGIIGASLRRPDTRNALLEQDFLYTLFERSEGHTKARVVGSLLDVLDVNTQRSQLLETMADLRIRIVSLTVTEKGYCHDPASGKLDASHSDIVHDLAEPDHPVSVPGLIVKALELRRAAGIAPFTVLSCDNLPNNGATTARIVIGFAALRGAGIENYIKENVAFPSTMVDRIVPATTEEDRTLVLSQTGLHDAWPVMTEPFSQWVVEDHFPAGRPALEQAGVEFVDDVAPFELMKLRMLNGSHSTLAYLGYLAGYEYVNQVIADPDFRNIAYRLMTEEAIPTLPMAEAVLHRYRDALLTRFANPALKHRTWQIAMDGSQKLPQRLLGTIRDQLAAGRSIECSALGVAAWMRYVTGVDEKGQRIDVRDPMVERLSFISKEAGGDPDALVDGLLKFEEIFGTDLPDNQRFRSSVLKHVGSLFKLGARKTTEEL
jgi:fructuronate reductase